jgi:L-lactate dehydrogenase (cytochrome)
MLTCVFRRPQPFLTVEDLRRRAHRVWPTAVREYVEGGADGAVTLEGNLRVFAHYRFHPRCLSGSPAADLGTTILGREYPVPFALAPTGYSRLMHPDGEVGVARAAGRAGVVYTASTMATTDVRTVAAASPDTDLWLQLYVFADRGITRELIARAGAAGCRTLVLTVDSAVTGNRPTHARSGLIPPSPERRLLLRTLIERPRWAVRHLRSGALGSPHLSPLTGSAGVDATEEMAFEPALSWDDVAEVRTAWPGALLLKGPLRPEEVKRAVALGVDGAVLSNHGGRQLDQLPAPVSTVGEVRAAIGDGATLLVDSGVRRGSDIAVALALGADAVLVGRPYVYGLGAAGQAGVAAAIAILTAELGRTLHLLGVGNVAELRAAGSDLVRG